MRTLQWSPRSSARDIGLVHDQEPRAGRLQWSPRSSARDMPHGERQRDERSALQWSPRSSARDIWFRRADESWRILASMEPSLFSEGYSSSVSGAKGRISCFNGALALQRGILCKSSSPSIGRRAASMEPSLFSEGYLTLAAQWASLQVGFNGALALQRGICPCGARDGHALRLASMEPSLFSEGYDLLNSANIAQGMQLQWSPRSSARDIVDAVHRHIARPLPASMEPSLFSEGYDADEYAEAVPGLLLQWSPRSSARDISLPLGRPNGGDGGFNGALALQRGISTAWHYIDRQATLLQWSPRSSARDNDRAGHGRGVTMSASMEPSLFSEGYQPRSDVGGQHGPASMEPSIFSEGYPTGKS